MEEHQVVVHKGPQDFSKECTYRTWACAWRVCGRNVRRDMLFLLFIFFLFFRFSIASIVDHVVSWVWVVDTAAAATPTATQAFALAFKPRREGRPSQRSYGFGYTSGCMDDGRSSDVNDSVRSGCPCRRRVGG